MIWAHMCLAKRRGDSQGAPSPLRPRVIVMATTRGARTPVSGWARMRLSASSCPMQQARSMGQMRGSFFSNYKPAAALSPERLRLPPKAAPRRSKRSRRRPDGRPTMAIRSRTAGGPSKKRGDPPAGRSRHVGQHSTIRTALHEPRRCGRCVGACSSNPAISLRRNSRPGQHWQERLRGLATVSATVSGTWGIASTPHTAKPQRSADGHS
jgi:hypothetical protein